MRMEQCLEVEFKLPEELDFKLGEVKCPTIILREVIGFDEEAISQPVYKSNPAAMVIELIHRCIAEVPGSERLPTKKEIKLLPIGILDNIVREIRKISVGEEIPFTVVCPSKVDGVSCGNEDTVVVNIDDILMTEGSFANKEVTLKRGITIDGVKLKKALVKCPDGYAQEQFAKDRDFFKFGEMTTDLLFSCIVDIDGVKATKEMISGMARIDRKLISEAIQKAPSLDLAAKVVCSRCSHEYEATVNLFDFLA